MKCAEYYLDNHKIEIYSTFFGKELVVVNNSTISERKSSTKDPHRFTLGNNSYDINSKLNITGPTGKTFEVYKNGEEMTLFNFKSQSSKSLLFLIVILGIAFGYVVGMYLFQMYPIDFASLQETVGNWF